MFESRFPSSLVGQSRLDSCIANDVLKDEYSHSDQAFKSECCIIEGLRTRVG